MCLAADGNTLRYRCYDLIQMLLIFYYIILITLLFYFLEPLHAQILWCLGYYLFIFSSGMECRTLITKVWQVVFSNIPI